ncbi:hypothetical protein HMPREF1008_00792 [Olsenella sp. oral taxon 809 str. F0356]|nr:hypothetical protein HMPREF1008_00792 [Olsenella sp. oral taxon 809 str. F0356]
MTRLASSVDVAGCVSRLFDNVRRVSGAPENV